MTTFAKYGVSRAPFAFLRRKSVEELENRKMAPNFRNRPSLADCGAETGQVGSEPTAPKNPHLPIGNSHQVSRAYYKRSRSGSEKSLGGGG